MDLFVEQREQNFKRAEPLAARMRPKTIEEFLGQSHFLGEGKLLRRMLEADRVTSAVFYGPPGTGKTTLAHLIAVRTNAHFVSLNAAGSSVKEVRDELAAARQRLGVEGRRTILFVDELHRFNRAQQDVLLNDVENGTVILIGATTENPFFAVNSPLISRSQIFRFEPLTVDEITALLYRAVADRERGYGNFNVKLTTEAAHHLAVTSDGDGRRALTALDVAVRSQMAGAGNAVPGQPSDSQKNAKAAPLEIVVDLKVAEDSIQRKALEYDATGDAHYDAISAMIKSIRGSDPDATVYWIARMLEGGEDPRFVARRIVIAAAEDVGNADPRGLIVAQAAADATHFIGMPECQLILAQAAIYLACAPKSNASAMAIWSATDDVKNNRTLPVPMHLRASGYSGAKQLGSGKGYQYPHDAPGGILDQDYLGVDKTYYEPTDRGDEARFREMLQRIRELRSRAHD
ncbi:MAG: replication-associated recombination protein A [Planctomycetes bacterium]|nr:replication-associated recombination protein A [Planctomycetota bacterium]MBI3833364.1 replication-associated recombination protein A [Planctomycetota bacterium]